MSLSGLIGGLAKNIVIGGATGGVVGGTIGGAGGVALVAIPAAPAICFWAAGNYGGDKTTEGAVVFAGAVAADLLIKGAAIGAGVGAAVGTVVGAASGAGYTLYHYDYYSSDVMGAHHDMHYHYNYNY
jgi:hypothetical protein